MWQRDANNYSKTTFILIMNRERKYIDFNSAAVEIIVKHAAVLILMLLFYPLYHLLVISLAFITIIITISTANTNVNFRNII